MSSILPKARRALTAAALLSSLPVALRADAQADEIQALREQIRLLDQKLRVLERKQELKEEEAAAAAKSAPKIFVNDKGVTLASGDGANSLRLRGLVQADSRWYFDDGGVATNDAFILRRARIIFEGTFNKAVSFQLVPEFGGSNTTLLDANIGLALRPGLQLKFGKFKSPVGLEQLQSDSWAFFAERSLVTNLVPNRDVGVTAGGEVLGEAVNYTLGVFNGVPDGASSSNSDFDDDKEFVARVFATPFKGRKESALAGLGLGVAASYAPSSETASALTSGYRTDGQQRFFSYAATTVADGDTWRISPQGYYYHGPFGALGEYVISTVNVRNTATGARSELQHDAWQVAAGYVLTGEDASYNGVVPRESFNPTAGTWGAFEVVGRVASLDLDDATFPIFASAATSATEVTSFGVGVNWYLTKSLRATVDYFQSDFKTQLTPTSALLRQDEKAVITRLQVAF
ncbi:MAG TPA: porin [Opitutaceae bacterium]